MSVMTATPITDLQHFTRAQRALFREIAWLADLMPSHVEAFQARIDAGDADDIGNTDFGRGLLQGTVATYTNMTEKMAHLQSLVQAVRDEAAQDAEDEDEEDDQ